MSQLFYTISGNASDFNLFDRQKHLTNDAVKAFFGTLDFEPLDEWVLLLSLDQDGNRKISETEFQNLVRFSSHSRHAPWRERRSPPKCVRRVAPAGYCILLTLTRRPKGGLYGRGAGCGVATAGLQRPRM